MRVLTAALWVLALCAGMASAQQAPRSAAPQTTTANVPTGHQVPGCADYRLENGQVVQRCAQSPRRMSEDYRNQAPATRGFMSGAGGGA